MTQNAETYKKRRIERLGGPGSLYLEVQLDEFRQVNDQHSEHVGTETLRSYAFDTRSPDDRADRVRGEVPDVDAPTAVYVGDNTGKHYIQSHDHDDIPADVWQYLDENGYVVLANVDGGWAQWDGRPEFSESYIDYSEAEVIEPGEMYEETEDGVRATGGETV